MKNALKSLVIASTLLVAAPAAFAASPAGLITYDNQFVLGADARETAVANMELLGVNFDPLDPLSGKQIVEIQKIVNDMGNATTKATRIQAIVGTRFTPAATIYID